MARGEGWWSVEGHKSRFVPVRAPFTGNLNGLLVADVVTGGNNFTVTIKTPARRLVPSTIRIGNSIEGRVFQRDGQRWPISGQPALERHAGREPAGGKQATAMIAPAGESKQLTLGPNRIEIPAGRWIRVIGLSADELALAKEI